MKLLRHTCAPWIGYQIIGTYNAYTLTEEKTFYVSKALCETQNLSCNTIQYNKISYESKISVADEILAAAMHFLPYCR